MSTIIMISNDSSVIINNNNKCNNSPDVFTKDCSDSVPSSPSGTIKSSDSSYFSVKSATDTSKISNKITFGSHSKNSMSTLESDLDSEEFSFSSSSASTTMSSPTLDSLAGIALARPGQLSNQIEVTNSSNKVSNNTKDKIEACQNHDMRWWTLGRGGKDVKRLFQNFESESNDKRDALNLKNYPTLPLARGRSGPIKSEQDKTDSKVVTPSVENGLKKELLLPQQTEAPGEMNLNSNNVNVRADAIATKLQPSSLCHSEIHKNQNILMHYQTLPILSVKKFNVGMNSPKYLNRFKSKSYYHRASSNSNSLHVWEEEEVSSDDNSSDDESGHDGEVVQDDKLDDDDISDSSDSSLDLGHRNGNQNLILPTGCHKHPKHASLPPMQKRLDLNSSSSSEEQDNTSDFWHNREIGHIGKLQENENPAIFSQDVINTSKDRLAANKNKCMNIGSGSRQILRRHTTYVKDLVASASKDFPDTEELVDQIQIQQQQEQPVHIHSWHRKRSKKVRICLAN